MGKGMKAGKRPSAGGAKGMQRQQMAQIQAMQQMMEKTQAEIEAKEVEASAGGGAVSVKVNGKKELVEVNLKPEVVDPDDIEMLQDLISKRSYAPGKRDKRERNGQGNRRTQYPGPFLGMTR